MRGTGDAPEGPCAGRGLDASRIGSPDGGGPLGTAGRGASGGARGAPGGADPLRLQRQGEELETPAGRRKGPQRSGILEAFLLVTVALVLALTLKTYVAEAYEIKGRSMEPTFLHGQRVVVLKAFYDVERYDIIVFTSTEDPTKDLVKRVVGLPGETLRVVGGRVYVDGRLLEETYVRPDRGQLAGDVFEERVPPGHYYVLGDNRPDSHDSRYFHAIPQSHIRGKVVIRWWPVSELTAF